MIYHRQAVCIHPYCRMLYLGNLYCPLFNVHSTSRTVRCTVLREIHPSPKGHDDTLRCPVTAQCTIRTDQHSSHQHISTALHITADYLEQYWLTGIVNWDCCSIRRYLISSHLRFSVIFLSRNFIQTPVLWNRYFWVSLSSWRADKQKISKQIFNLCNCQQPVILQRNFISPLRGPENMCCTAHFCWGRFSAAMAVRIFWSHSRTLYLLINDSRYLAGWRLLKSAARL